MAKRIKIKGKAPRGLSKSDRILDYRGKIVKKIASRDPDHPGIPFPSRARLNDTAPSSTRKKLVKEGNRKFIGPRPLKEFDPYEEIDSPDESEHRLSRGYTKSQRRSDEAEFLRGLPQNQKLSRAEQNMLKGDIARSATSKEGKLLNKLLSALRAQELAKYREMPF